MVGVLICFVVMRELRTSTSSDSDQIKSLSNLKYVVHNQFSSQGSRRDHRKAKLQEYTVFYWHNINDNIHINF